MVIAIILVVVLVALALLSTYRLVMLRRGGTAAILRVLPARGGERWRHGVIRYDEDHLVFYKLTSLKPGADSVIRRRGIEIGDRRGPRGDEYDIMTDAISVRSEEHTSELQSRENIVCRLLHEKKNDRIDIIPTPH